MSPIVYCFISSNPPMPQIFTHVTNQMSKSSVPTILFVLPMYKELKKKLTTHANNSTLLPCLQFAAAAGLTKLNKYYDMAWANQFYWITTDKYTTYFYLNVIHQSSSFSATSTLSCGMVWNCW